ncbi:MAG TPA: SRPBCC family protein [Gemmatimonadales bacterium]|nr:SRPBCC family protein [Gemmatimonadales bacterium]
MAGTGIHASALIHAPPREVYAIIADYRAGHPQILPRPPFVSLDVEQGGTGEGTVIRVRMRVLGKAQEFRATVSEPEPGRVLVESNDTGYVTVFTVDPENDGRHSRVGITTTHPVKRGPLAALERWFTGRLLRPVYQRELALLESLGVRAAEAAAQLGG